MKQFQMRGQDARSAIIEVWRREGELNMKFTEFVSIGLKPTIDDWRETAIGADNQFAEDMLIEVLSDFHIEYVVA